MNFTESTLNQQCDENAVRQWSHSQGERPAEVGPAGDKSRAGDQPQDCESARPRSAAALLALPTM